ncbi:MAG TPA: hypothetical protein PL182_00195 [Pseudobdellovibrionaceae bacterium]|nr:hypothetical protein [Pseudobdellovibrionaceae bacterium]
MIKPKDLHGGRFLWGAHHPHCERHRHHLIWIGHHPFCLGCTAMLVGLLLGAIWFAFFSPPSFTLAGWVLFHFFLLIPTVLQPFLQMKTFKILSRTSLGFCVASFFLTGFFSLQQPISPVLFHIFQITSFFLVYRVLSGLRSMKIDNPCAGCPHGNYPVCDWNLPRLLETTEQKEIFTNFKRADCRKPL